MRFINIFLAEEKEMEAELKRLNTPSAFKEKHQGKTSSEMERPGGRRENQEDQFRKEEEKKKKEERESLKN